MDPRPPDPRPRDRARPLAALRALVARHAPQGAPPAWSEGTGPRLIVVAGPAEGAVFDLRGEGPWWVGRGPGTQVRLAEDPYASRAALRIRRLPDGSFAVEAVPGAANQPTLETVALPPGMEVPLRPGTVLGAGASRLLFRVG